MADHKVSARVKKAIAAFTDPAVAYRKFNEVPSGRGEEERLWYVRWIELMDIDARTNASSCTDIAVARQKYKEPLSGSEAERIWYARWVELADAGAKADAASCVDVAVARQKCRESPRDSEAKSIWELRWAELIYSA